MTNSTSNLPANHLFSVVRKHLVTIFLFIFCSAFQTIVNAQTVQGTVNDESGKPLAAVSVTVQGTSRGTITNENGIFTISASPGAVLVVSSVGYQNKEVKVGNETSLSISLALTSSQL